MPVRKLGLSFALTQHALRDQMQCRICIEGHSRRLLEGCERPPSLRICHHFPSNRSCTLNVLKISWQGRQLLLASDRRCLWCKLLLAGCCWSMPRVVIDNGRVIWWRACCSLILGSSRRMISVHCMERLMIRPASYVLSAVVEPTDIKHIQIYSMRTYICI
jgi:hypothetical protein